MEELPEAADVTRHVEKGVGDSFVLDNPVSEAELAREVGRWVHSSEVLLLDGTNGEEVMYIGLLFIP